MTRLIRGVIAAVAAVGLTVASAGTAAADPGHHHRHHHHRHHHHHAPVTPGPAPAPAPAPAPGPTPAPGPAAGGTAAAAFGWGTPIGGMSDEFDGTAIDTAKWGVPGECWPANSTVKAGRCASHDSVGGGVFTETGTADGRTGYLSAHTGQRYGRWEARMQVVTTAPGRPFHPVLLLWPDSQQWPQGGEEDYVEVNSDSTRIEAFLHHPTQPGTTVQDHYTSAPIDLAGWHTYGFQWEPSGLTGYIDGAVWFTDTRAGFNPPGPMHQTIQLDNPTGTSGMATVAMRVDWLRAYAP